MRESSVSTDQTMTRARVIHFYKTQSRPTNLAEKSVPGTLRPETRPDRRPTAKASCVDDNNEGYESDEFCICFFFFSLRILCQLKYFFFFLTITFEYNIDNILLSIILHFSRIFRLKSYFFRIWFYKAFSTV